MQSGWSVGLVMIMMGALCVRGFGAPYAPSSAGWLIAGVLIGCGALLFLRRPFAWWAAIAAAALTILTGLLALAGRPQWALPAPPPLSIVVGLYMMLRLLIARSYFRRRGNVSSVESQ